MGYAFHGTCFVVLADAQAADCVASYPSQGLNGASVVTVSCTGYGPTGLQVARSVDGGTPAPLVLATSYADCNPAEIMSAVPSAGDMGAAFAFGFAAVVTCFLFAFAAGQVLAFVGSNK